MMSFNYLKNIDFRSLNLLTTHLIIIFIRNNLGSVFFIILKRNDSKQDDGRIKGG